MGRPLDEMTFTVIRRPGEWIDGPWVPGVYSLKLALDGDPTPKSVATLDDTDKFAVGEWALFYDTAGEQLGIAKIVGIAGTDITFTTNSLTWDAGVGDQVAPALLIEASRPQPLGFETLELLPEGARSSARFIIYAGLITEIVQCIPDSSISRCFPKKRSTNVSLFRVHHILPLMFTE